MSAFRRNHTAAKKAAHRHEAIETIVENILSMSVKKLSLSRTHSYSPSSPSFSQPNCAEVLVPPSTQTILNHGITNRFIV